MNEEILNFYKHEIEKAKTNRKHPDDITKELDILGMFIRSNIEGYCSDNGIEKHEAVYAVMQAAFMLVKNDSSYLAEVMSDIDCRLAAGEELVVYL